MKRQKVLMQISKEKNVRKFPFGKKEKKKIVPFFSLRVSIWLSCLCSCSYKGLKKKKKERETKRKKKTKTK